eukprot:5684829-Lingulodinium_polyedra.AAC.1
MWVKRARASHLSLGHADAPSLTYHNPAVHGVEEVGDLMKQPGKQAVLSRRHNKGVPKRGLLRRESAPRSLHCRAPGE